MGLRYNVDVFQPDPGGDERRSAFLRDLWATGLTTGSPEFPKLDYEVLTERWDIFRASQADIDLPRKWPLVRSRIFRGRVHWGHMSVMDQESESTIPYPEILGDPSVSLSLYAPTPPEWYVVFGAADREVDDTRSEIFVPVSAARRHFRAQFAKLSNLFWWPEKTERAAPNGSLAWAVLRKALSIFDAGRYLRVLKCLAADLSPSAVFVLNYFEELPGAAGAGPTPEEYVQFHERVQFVNRVLDRLGEFNFELLAAESLLSDKEVSPYDFLGLLVLMGEPKVSVADYLSSDDETGAYYHCFELFDKYNGRLSAYEHARRDVERGAS